LAVGVYGADGYHAVNRRGQITILRAVVAAGRDHHAAARQSVPDHVFVRSRVVRVESRFRGPETHIEHLSAQIDGAFDALVNVRARAQPDRVSLAGHLGRAEHAHRQEAAFPPQTWRDALTHGADDAGARGAVPYFIRRIVVGVVLVAGELDAGGEIALLKLHGVPPGPQSRPQFRMSGRHARVHNRDDDSRIAYLVSHRFRRIDQIART